MSHLNVSDPPKAHGLSNGGGGRSEASSVSIDAYEGSHHTPHTEDMRSPVNSHDDDSDLHTAVTAPLLTRTATDADADAGHSPSPHHHHHHQHHNSNTNGTSSNLHTRGSSPHLHSLSPCTNASVSLPPHSAHLWAYQLDGRRDEDVESAERSVTDLFSAASQPASSHAVRAEDNVSFASEAGTRRLASRVVSAGDPGGASTSPLTSTFPAESRSRTVLHRLLSVVKPSITAFRERLHNMTWRRILWVVLLVALVMVGNFMQIVMLNFWLISFPSDGTPGNYTAFAVPGIFFAVLFALLFGAYAVIRRPSLRFATHLHGWGILLGVGFADAFNSWMATYAASYTSEVLQALFTNLCPLYAVFLSKWILHDTRRYANIYIASVFVLTICGILAASLYGLIEDRNVSEGKWWILIFFLSMPVRVLMNVWQSLYMVVYTRDPKFVPWLRVRLAEETPSTVDAEAPAEGEIANEGEENGRASVTSVTGRHRLAASVDSMEDDPAKKVDNANGNNHNNNNNSSSSGDGARFDPHPTNGQNSSNARREGGAARHAGAAADKAECDDWTAEKKKPYVEGEDALAVTGDPDSDPAPPRIAIITPAQGERQRARLHGGHKSPPPQKVSSANDLDAESGADLDGGDEPIASADILHGEAVAVEETPFGVREEEEEEDVLTPTSAAAPPLPTQTMFTVRYNQGEDTIVKLVMLAGETFIQMCFTLSLLPADALPWWGNSDTVEATWDNFKEGIRCVFTIRENFLYCFLYTLGFVFTYVGSAYLNHYSAALCSIVSQLSSPVTALMLVIVPSWNVQEDGDSPWYCNVVAIVFLCIAALLYVMWEEMTDHEKVQTEYELKMVQLRVRPSSHEKPHPVIMDE